MPACGTEGCRHPTAHPRVPCVDVPAPLLPLIHPLSTSSFFSPNEQVLVEKQHGMVLLKAASLNTAA